MDVTTEEAAGWLLELQRQGVTEERIAAWHVWLNADARHKRVFDQLQTVQDCIDAAPSLPWPTDEEVAADLTSIPDAAPSKWRRSPVAWAAAAAVAAVAVGVCGYLMLRFHHDMVVATSVAEVRRMSLPDSSTVTLGGRSRIAVDMSDNAREITLSRGEAFFEVSSDPKRPFTVRAGDTAVRAVGTAFDVRRAGERVTVAVSEGKVVITRGRQRAITLTAGHQVHLDAEQAATPVSRATDNVAGWREGRRQYLAEPLEDVLADLSRYSSRRIVMDDDSVGKLAITGAVFERDIERWLRSLQDALPVNVYTDADGTVHVRGITAAR